MNLYHSNSEPSVKRLQRRLKNDTSKGCKRADQPFSGWDFSYGTGSERLPERNVALVLWNDGAPIV